MLIIHRCTDVMEGVVVCISGRYFESMEVKTAFVIYLIIHRRVLLVALFYTSFAFRLMSSS